MITHRGFSAWISSEGQTLCEFEQAVDVDENKISCWIASTEGKTFTIHWRDHGGNVDTASYIYLDGHIVPGRFIFGSGDAQRSGVRVGSAVERPFTFAKKGAGTQPASSVGTSTELGTIMLKIKRVKRTRAHLPNLPHVFPDESLHNRRKGQHYISFGRSRPTRPQILSTWAFEPYDEKHPGSYVTFVFRYRSAEFLMNQGIMSATDLDTEDDTLDDTPTPSPQIDRGALLTPSPSPSPPAGPSRVNSSFENLTCNTSQGNSFYSGEDINL